MIRVGSDFSGVGAFDQALMRLGMPYKTIFSCDMDLYARETYIANYGEPVYYPFDVYERDIPAQPLEIYMTSPPCQAFSLAGKRKGEDDKRGVLFYNSHEFIIKNKPRYFIFENVKGLLSDAKGRTFQVWLDMLGGKSVNGNLVIFPREDSTPYHIYYKVLNAKHYGVPQNRERVFIIGIRDDVDNVFNWPKPFPLSRKLKDVLETQVDEKYYLSDKMLLHLSKHERSQDFISEDTTNTNCITANYAKQSSDLQYLKVKSATQKGYEVATENDSINLSNLSSETRRGRVGKEVAQTLDTACNQAVMVSKEVRTMEAKAERRATGTNNFRAKQIEFREQTSMNTIQTGLTNDNLLKIDYKIRRLTPRECFRLMDFPDSFKIDQVSNTQAYKQAGNSIVVNVLAQIIGKLKFN